MKMMSKFFLVSIIFLIACSSHKVTVTKILQKNDKPDTTKYSTYWTAMRCGKPELIDNFNVENEKKEFANGIKLIKNGEISNAELIFSKIVNESKNDTIINNSKEILNQLYIYQSKWKEYLKSDRKDNETDSANILHLLWPAFMYSSSEKISYSSETDTLKIHYKSGLIFIPVNINGKEYEFLFDTGAQFSTISTEIAADASLKNLFNHKSALIGSTDLSSDIETSAIDNLKIGNLSIQNSPCILTDPSNMKFKFWFYTFLSFDGIIGWNVIKNMDVEIDFKNELMIIKKPHKTDNSKKNLFWLNDPIVQLKSISGTDLLFFFDSGAQESRFYDLLLMKLYPDEIEEDNETIYGLGGKVNVDTKTIPKISFVLDNYMLNFKNINSGISKNNKFFVFDGVLGSDVGKNGKIRIDALNGIFEIENNENK